MLLTQEQVIERLDNPDNLVHRKIKNVIDRKLARVRMPELEGDSCAIAPLHNGGRRPGDTNLDKEVRASIGAEAQIATLAKVANAHGISLHHAHELANGKHSIAQGVNTGLVDDINKKLEEPHDIAVRKLTKVLLAIPEEGLQAIKAKDLTSMASQLSKVAENTAPLKHDDPNNGGPQFIVYAPTVKQENHYESVEVATPTSVEE